MKENTCCFFGHREIHETIELREKLTETVERLINDKKWTPFCLEARADLTAYVLKW